ncbi:MAG: hypothetical protein RLZZ301_286 [Bacteroidota bacterium]|jgi:hypothetical protein
MLKQLIFAGIIVLSSQVKAQLYSPLDSIRVVHRSVGNTDSLLHFMDGFSASYFVQPQSVWPNPCALVMPGFSPLSNCALPERPATFSALPHMGFAYGFGAQGAQRMRVDVEESFRHQLLLNVRYDRWQRTGFIRNDELRYSALDVLVMQRGKRHEVQLRFRNASDDRSWSGGLASYAALGTLAPELIPVQKNDAYSQKNAYQLKLNWTYLLVGDSLRHLRVQGEHQYANAKRLYHEVDSLAWYYPQVQFSPDSTNDRFTQHAFAQQLGLGIAIHTFDLTSQLAYKARYWSDLISIHDTTEINWHNQVKWKQGAHQLAHQDVINLYGAAQGVNSQSKYLYKGKAINYTLVHTYSNQWPQLMQRNYQGNLANYSTPNLQKEKVQQIQIQAGSHLNRTELEAQFDYLSFSSVYRYVLDSMRWYCTGPQSQGNVIVARVSANYALAHWHLRPTYVYTHLSTGSYVPQHRAQLAIQWHGAVFKKRLQVHFEGIGQWQSANVALVYLPFMESVNWNAGFVPSYASSFNAQANLAIEVKTFRFFVNVANLGHFWNPAPLSMVAGYPFPGMQVRMGLTWDFWN